MNTTALNTCTMTTFLVMLLSAAGLLLSQFFSSNSRTQALLVENAPSSPLATPAVAGGGSPQILPQYAPESKAILPADEAAGIWTGLVVMLVLLVGTALVVGWRAAEMASAARAARCRAAEEMETGRSAERQGALEPGMRSKIEV